MRNFKLFNDLVTSLEDFGQMSEEQGFNPEQVKEELDDNVAAMESYIKAYKLASHLNESGNLSMETFSSVMEIAESNIKYPKGENISLEDETSPSMLKQIKDKFASTFKSWVEKLKSAIDKMMVLAKTSVSKLSERLKKAETEVEEDNVSQEAFFGFGKKKLTAADLWLIINPKNNQVYDINEILDSLIYLTDQLANDTIIFIRDSIRQMESTFYVNKESRGFHRKVLPEKDFKKLKSTFEKIGTETKSVEREDKNTNKYLKTKTLPINYIKVNASNAFGLFSYTVSQNPDTKSNYIYIDASRIQSSAQMVEVHGFGFPKGEVDSSSLEKELTKSNIVKLNKKVKEVNNSLDVMYKANRELLSDMSAAVVNALFKGLSDEQWVKIANNVIDDIKAPISRLYDIPYDVMDLTNETCKQLEKVVK